MANLTVDFTKEIGKIKPMHAVGQPPFVGMDFSYVSYLKEANIPYSRLHDVGGAYGGFKFVDIPNIFRDFDADENDPNSYDFAFTDVLIQALMDNNCPPVFRLGVTIENYPHIKIYRIHPPADFAKWARICEHIVRHYNEGWADGFHYGIEYWEIWNEPENNGPTPKNMMWTGTMEQYLELYGITAKHLKNCFGDTIKVGGFASCGFYGLWGDPKKYGMDIEFREKEHGDLAKEYYIDFFKAFLAYNKENNVPMDFFSWHSYANVQDTMVMAKFVEKTMNEYGYGDVETHLNEWNNAHTRYKRGKSVASVQACAMLCGMQSTKTTMLCYYDARIGHSVYGGLFNPITYEPFCTYYPFKAFGELYKMGTQVACDSDDSEVYAVAAMGNGKKGVLIANCNKEPITLKTNLEVDFKLYRIDENHLMTEDIFAPEIEVDAEQVLFIVK
ncbi:MAG: hypothetical protein IJE10_05365 [Clostridia bacterium]|nr:hypothetical protein [Clostridia bacterium]